MLQRFKPALLELCAVGTVGDTQTREGTGRASCPAQRCTAKANLVLLLLLLLLLLLQSSATSPCASRVAAVAAKVAYNCMVDLLAVQPAEAQTLQLLPCISACCPC
jgi:hypothetical protein